jgi:mannose-6-phosphate isomerase
LTPEQFSKAIEDSKTDTEVTARLLNETPVTPGNVYLIAPRAVHAIGYGCLILEVQEPTDFTIQPEYFCGDYQLSGYEMYLGLTKADALGCFNFDLNGPQSVSSALKIPALIAESAESKTERLIGSADTPCFAVNRITVKTSFALNSCPSVYIVTDGNGGLAGENNYSRPLKKGDYFFLPFAARGKFTIRTEKGLTLIECISGKRETAVL